MLKKIKDWLIHKLGGKTAEEYNDLYKIHQNSKRSPVSRIIVQSELDLSEHPLFSEDDVLERGKNFVIRDLGKAVYDHATHEVKDGKYTATVVIMKH